MSKKVTVELLEAQRRIKAEQVADLGIKRKVESLEVHLDELRATLAKHKPVVNARLDESERQIKVEKLRSTWNAPTRHLARTEFDSEATEWNNACARLCHRIGSGFIVGLVGIRGPGKTQIGVEVMREATAQLRSAYYCTAVDYFIRIKDSFRNDAEKNQAAAQQFFVRPKLLVIDEMHVRSDSAWEDNMLTDLIGKRYNAVLDTVLISNQTLAEFTRSIGPSIMDRLNETGGILECKWKSFRK